MVDVDTPDGGELDVEVSAHSDDGQRRERHRTPTVHACG
jgi:hypothetical protein